MATLATLTDRLIDTVETTETPALRGNDFYRLRPIANEDVVLWTKAIDNSKVKRLPDAQASRTCWKIIAASTMTVLLVTAMLLPTVYSLLAGYEIQKLKVEQQKQLQEQASLDRQVATLLSPERLAALAEQQAFTDPAPGKTVFLNPHGDGKMAMNRTAADNTASAQE